jgi:hypothetical protein
MKVQMNGICHSERREKSASHSRSTAGMQIPRAARNDGHRTIRKARQIERLAGPVSAGTYNLAGFIAAEGILDMASGRRPANLAGGSVGADPPADERRVNPPVGLPEVLRPLFWEYDFDVLSWETDRDLVIARILARGDLAALRWLRAQLGDEAIRVWIEGRQGRGLTPQQLRFWEDLLGIPHRRVSAWLAAPSRQVWDRRAEQ